MTQPVNFDIIILGHFAKDKLVIDGVKKNALGGAVYYGSMALSKMNISTGIITLLSREDFCYLDILEKNGVKVFAHEADMTSGIENIYRSENLDKRICKPLGFAGEFRKKHIPDVTTKVFHIGPIMAGEVSLDLIDWLTSKFDKVSLDLQGVLRVREGNQLTFSDWSEKERGLKRIHTIKADSVESKVITGEKDIAKAAKIIAGWGPREVAITHKDGLLVYGEGEIFEAPFTPRVLKGRTGRGDTCISAYLARRLKASPEESCRFAAAVTSLKLEKEGPFDRTVEDIVEKLTGQGNCENIIPQLQEKRD
ncbi:MAG: PfkB family carbohydrate kinase [Candidatus Neomarinimicrobiota bacterium]